MTANDKIVPASPGNMARAAQVLRDGGLVVIPTETVYGVAANALDEAAIKRLYAAKDRPHGKPLIVFVASIAAAREIANFTPLADKLAGQFWPGQLTMVFDRRPGKGVSSSMFLDETIGIRIPGQPETFELLKTFAAPLAVTSANLSGGTSPARVEDLAQDFLDRIDLVLDAGPAIMGVESTVVDVRGEAPVILREGSIPLRELS